MVGTQANIGSATRPTEEACLYVIASPVGSYFDQGERPLRLLIGDHCMRSTPDFGRAKTGGNYAAALRFTMDAKKRWQADQVLFSPGGDVQETGAANFLMFDDTRIHGVPSAGVRYGELAMARGQYSFNLLEQYRLDLFLDQAWGRVRAAGVPGVVEVPWEPVTGVGAAFNLRVPGRTMILRGEVGKSFLQSRFDGLGSTTVQVMLLKPL